MSGQISDQQLVERVQRGDKNAFNLLVQKYQNKVMSLISRYIRNQADIADVAQEAFIKAYRALPNFRGESAFYTWLYRIAVNTAKNHLVSQSRKTPANSVDAEEAEYYEGSDALKEFASPERLVLSDEINRVIFETLETLPEELKIAISLRELDGMSYEDIANIMDCPVGTVRSRIFRARESIDKKLQPLLEQ
ncbi:MULTISPECIES: RNA polymerase sigma factor RpoE [unclassified Shewanella]|uniref:RNA polymerase sigma factor RpoE n=1 Tax=unclassified Shewanella TaxID=196818 RepID=UPI000C819CF3|nr:MULTISPECIES: RNA polymerase sigma factor RpoE [unclassified Shewanella]MDO6617492.1 RNA polymerase sigma factor RpoE [Shewanella sp. 6_MG-2023]MDO6638777.1 RNA polymerase sigma factor RpoE [Shewanella sp. 5_MG-2023]MDO6677132.1 RNA polymerase sigma factor RpoE [Shewanella sp. 4_MG-2023]MDO6773795.1 RNA polymerase sigma factor RpoE [Shewanella sp. 3_MG-2023]PMG31405.1 RNA polymerase sigma factor RpoE [Shewanella sp. 10N.286.52.C2]